MFNNWKLGTVKGIPIYVHWSFWLLPLLIVASAMPGTSLALRLIVLFAVFGCVILHELGHAMMARLFRVGTRDITVYPIGGVARLDRMPKSPFAEGAIAIAGPAVNVAIVALLLPLQMVIGLAGDSVLAMFVQNLIVVNVILVLFNLLPVFPMDGGRIFRAGLGLFVPYLKATQIAARTGQVLAVLMAIAGLFFGGTLIFVAAFAFLAAGAELALVRQQSQFPDDDQQPPSNQSSSNSPPPGRKTYVLLDRDGHKIASY